MSEHSPTAGLPIQPHSGKDDALLGWALTGVAVGLVVLLLVAAPGKWQFAGALAAVVALALLALRRTKEVALRLVAASMPFAGMNFFLGGVPAEYHPGGAQRTLELSLTDLSLVPLLGVVIGEIATRRKRLYFGDLGNWLLLGFLGWAGVSLLHAPDAALGLAELFRLGKIFLIYVLMVHATESVDHVKLVLRGLVIGAVGQAAFAAYQYHFGTPSFMYFVTHGGEPMATEEFTTATAIRVGGLVGYPVDFAQYLLIMIPLALWRVLVTRKPSWRVASTIPAGLCLLALVLTHTRGAMLIAPLIAVAFVWLAAGALGWKGRLKILVAALLVLALIGVGLSGLVLLRFHEVQGSSEARLNMWRVAISIISANPLLGVGINNYALVMHKYDALGYINGYAYPVHNVFLFFAAENGIPGLLLVGGFVALIYRRGWRLCQKLEPQSAVAVLAMLVAFSGPLLYGQIDQGFKYITTVWSLLWLMAGMISSLDLRLSERPGKAGLLHHALIARESQSQPC